MSPAKIVSREEWHQSRIQLLEKEKEMTRARDTLAKEVRELPMVEVTKQYSFTTMDQFGKERHVHFRDLFDGRRQLVIYHFMLDPTWNAGCTSCSLVGDSIPRQLEHLWARDTSLVVISRAPIASIAAFKKRMGWSFPWFSSYESDFNYDFHVTADEQIAPVEYNFRTADELKKRNMSHHARGEQPGLSTFILGNGEDVGEIGKIYHTYSTYARGIEVSVNTFMWLDMTYLGRQDNMTGVDGLGFKHHDKYDTDDLHPTMHDRR